MPAPRTRARQTRRPARNQALGYPRSSQKSATRGAETRCGSRARPLTRHSLIGQRGPRSVERVAADAGRSGAALTWGFFNPVRAPSLCRGPRGARRWPGEKSAPASEEHNELTDGAYLDTVEYPRVAKFVRSRTRLNTPDLRVGTRAPPAPSVGVCGRLEVRPSAHARGASPRHFRGSGISLVRAIRERLGARAPGSARVPAGAPLPFSERPR